MSDRHRLLQRQLKQLLGQEEPPEALRDFIDAVDRAYREFDEDRLLLERSLELSSQELLQANSEMRILFDALPDLLFRVAADGVVLGYHGHVEGIEAREQLIGKKIQDILGGAAKQEFERALSDSRRNHRMELVEYSVPVVKEERFYEARFLPLNDTQTVVIIRNTTDRKKLEASLIQSQKLDTVGTLAGGIAHDLNNQLTPLVGYLSLLLEMVGPQDEKRVFLEEAQQATKRCKEVVARLLNFSRPGTQKKKTIGLSVLMEELQKFLPRIIPTTIRVETVYPKDLWTISGNETELETVFINMAVNARDAMANGGSLVIRAQNVELGSQNVRPGFEPGKYVLVSVRDTGSGISKEALSRIFEPFFTTKERGQGTGLGLAMVFSIINDHRGWIDVISEVGRGTVFEVYLPAMSGNGPLPNGNGSLGPAFPHGSETIVLADDEESVLALGRLILERLGYCVLPAKDGEEALRVYSEHRDQVGAVILDVMMPKLTGTEVLDRILAIDPRAKVILSSGFSENNAVDFIKKGARDFVQKPYTALSLAQSVRKCLDLR